MANWNKKDKENVDEENPNRGISHDFLTDRKWIVFLSGFSESGNPVYTVYRVFIFITFVYMLLMSVVACVFKPEKQLIVTATHSILLNVFCIWALSTRIVTQRSIDNTRAIIISGVYCYEDEEEDQELMNLKKSIPNEIHAKSNIFLVIYILGAVSNAVLFPASQVLFFVPDLPKDARIVNPYFPQLFYQVFDMRTRLGFLFGFLVGIVYFSILYAVAVGSNWMYISFSVQMKVHFQVLNYSIKNIQKRASIMYSKNFGRHFQGPKEVLKTREFEWCLYNCLRSNIRHHQALLRFMNAFKPYYGSYILDLFTVASSVFGALLYLINQVPSINILITLVVSFVAEQFSVIYVCMLGEDVIAESQKLFRRLYSISWFNYSRRFNQLLRPMMTNTLRPMGLKALLLGVPASLEVYGSIISAMYKVCSCVRQSDVV